MKRVLAASLIALIAFAFCLQGARWQFERHEVRHANNELIRANVSKAPITEQDLFSLPNDESAWRKIKISGKFIPENEILVRGRYNQGLYGFGVVTLFESTSGRKYWVDRGWVKAGPDAKTPPIVTSVDDRLVELIGRVRVERIESQISGTVFALPSRDGSAQIAKWDNDGSIKTELFYFDLLETSASEFAPDSPTALPELSDGPHLAYTVQWILFAGLVLFGLFLVIREERRTHSAKA